MGVIVREADDGDMLRLVTVFSEAFKREEPFVDATVPEHWTPSGREAAAERWRITNKTDPNTHYLKAIDDATGIIVGFAKWNIYRDTFPSKDITPGTFPEYKNKEDEDFAMAIIEDFMICRDSIITRTNGNVASLDILAVHPKYQKQGVGHALVKWGLTKADQYELEACVESSVHGKKLYEKNGFIFERDVALTIPDKFKDRPGPMEFAWLIRPKKQTAWLMLL